MTQTKNIGTMSKPSMNPVLRGFWSTPSRFKVLYGGRSSSKSWDAAANSVRVAQKVNVRILCVRMFQNKIKQSVYTLIKNQIARFGLSDKFKILGNEIQCLSTGSEFFFYGLARNYEEIKSTEDVDILWIEEAHFLTKEMWIDLEPTIRNEGSEIWIIFNPKLATDFAYQRFVVDPPEGAVVRQINYDENGFLSNTMRATIDRMREEDPEEFDHIYGGQPRQDDDSVIIKRSWVMAAIDAHKKLGIEPTGAQRLGYDVGDTGDNCATVRAKGLLTQEIREWQGSEDELMKSAKIVYAQAREHQAKIWYDNIGVGAFSGSKFQELNAETKARIKYDGFGAGSRIHKPEKIYQHGIKNKDFFSNLKAQAWWLVADRFRNTYAAIHNGEKFKDHELIAIDGSVDHLEKLIDELCTPKKDFDSYGKVKVQSKKDLVSSPNIAEAFIIAYSPLIASSVNYGDIL